MKNDSSLVQINDDIVKKLYFIHHDEKEYCLASGTDILFFRLKVPTTNENETRKALPFIIEDELAVDPDQVHIAFSIPDQQGFTSVAVVNKDIMKIWAKYIEKKDNKILHIIPELFSINLSNEEVVLIDRGSNILFFNPSGNSFCCDDSLFPNIFSENYPISDTKIINAYTNRADKILPNDNKNIKINLLPNLSDDEFKDRVRKGIETSSINLLSGAFKPIKYLNELITIWLRPIIISLSFIFIYPILIILETHYLDSKILDVKLKLNQVYNSIDESIGNRQNPIEYIKTILADKQENQSKFFLTYTNILFQTLSEIQGSRLISINFENDNKILSVNLSVLSYEDVETIQNNLSSKGLMVREGNSRLVDNKVITEIKLGER